MTGFGSGSPCGACKFLRRKCVKGCVFAPYFRHEQGASHFSAIHKVFGASNVSKLLMHLPVSARCEAAVTISYEAQARLRDPMYGCVAHIFALRQQVVNLKAQLESLKAQASQGYTNGSSISNPQEDNFKLMAYQQGDARTPQPEESCPTVKNESQCYFGYDLMACTSVRSSQDYNLRVYTSDYTASFNDETNPSFTHDMQEDVQNNGYYDTQDLQSVAFAYLN